MVRGPKPKLREKTTRSPMRVCPVCVRVSAHGTYLCCHGLRCSVHSTDRVAEVLLASVQGSNEGRTYAVGALSQEARLLPSESGTAGEVYRSGEGASGREARTCGAAQGGVAMHGLRPSLAGVRDGLRPRSRCQTGVGRAVAHRRICASRCARGDSEVRSCVRELPPDQNDGCEGWLR
jgi:hypothetical protein